MPNSAYTIIFSAIVGTICAAVLVGADMGTEKYIKANQEAEKDRNIMEVLGISYPDDATAPELVDFFEDKLKESTVQGLTVYKYSNAEGTAVAVLFRGSGVWGPIKGVLALEPDLRTIRGIAFYEQEETPGLGAKIATEEFTSRFVGKKIGPPEGGPDEAGMKITPPGQAGGPTEVDGITGATMTSDRVEKMLNDVISEIVAKVNGNV
ncbi:MAG: FMN-binding protein [Planctomycetota bacterium]